MMKDWIHNYPFNAKRRLSLIRVFSLRTLTFLVVSCQGSNMSLIKLHTLAYEPKFQQSGMCPYEDSDQPWHPPSLIKVFAARLNIPHVVTGSYPLSISAPNKGLNFSFVFQSQSLRKKNEMNNTCTPPTPIDNCVLNSTCNALLNCKVFTMTHDIPCLYTFY